MVKLVTFAGRDGSPSLGVVRGEQVHAVPGVRDVLDLLESGTALSALDERAEGSGRPLGDVRLLAPILRPRRNVFCVGRNYQEHRDEGDRARGTLALTPTPGQAEEYPAFFTKVPEAVIGPGAGVRFDGELSTAMDWEAELALIIGRAGRDIPEERALEHVFGYCCGNDVTLRDLQRRHGGQWFKGKSWDTAAPLGPWVVTADEIPDPQGLDIACRVNGVQKQRSNTSKMIFSVARIIHELSRGMRLLPGDVIMTGTPEGVGFARTPPEYMKVGDEVEVEITHLGVLRNPIVAANGD